MRKLQCGIIGLGVGSKHLQTLDINKLCNVKSICDLDLKKLSFYKKKYPNIITTDNYMEIIQDSEIDLVCIASYDNFHTEQLIQAIKKNKNIFIEKPICLNFSEYLKIKNYIKKNKFIQISSNFVRYKSLNKKIT